MTVRRQRLSSVFGSRYALEQPNLSVRALGTFGKCGSVRDRLGGRDEPLALLPQPRGDRVVARLGVRGRDREAADGTARRRVLREACVRENGSLLRCLRREART